MDSASRSCLPILPSGKNTVAIARAARAEIERTNREVPTVRLTLLNDQAKFIERSIEAVTHHVYIGSFLVIGIIFLFLRDWRATFIVCLASDESRYSTGAEFVMDGGLVNNVPHK